MIRFETNSGSVYEIDPDKKQCRKVGDPKGWKTCNGAGALFGADEFKFGEPIVGARYVIFRPKGEIVTTPVKTILAE